VQITITNCMRYSVSFRWFNANALSAHRVPEMADRVGYKHSFICHDSYIGCKQAGTLSFTTHAAHRA
jgi:hypothetical protein